MPDLKPCPCGKVPEELFIDEIAGWYYAATGDCERENCWGIVFCLEPGTDLGAKAAREWHEAPREHEPIEPESSNVVAFPNEVIPCNLPEGPGGPTPRGE